MLLGCGHTGWQALGPVIGHLVCGYRRRCCRLWPLCEPMEGLCGPEALGQCGGDRRSAWHLLVGSELTVSGLWPWWGSTQKGPPS